MAVQPLTPAPVVPATNEGLQPPTQTPAAASVEHVPSEALADTPPTRTDSRWWSSLLRAGLGPWLVASDVAACAAAGLVAPSPFPLAVYFGVVLLGFLAMAGMYRSRLTLSVLDDLPRLVQAWLMAVAVMEVSAQLVLGEFVGIALSVVAGLALVLTRVGSYPLIRALRRRGVSAHSTIVVGVDRTGVAVVRQILQNPQTGLRVIGFVDDLIGDDASGSLPVSVLGGPSSLSAVLAQYSPHALIIAHTSMPEETLVSMIRACHRHHCELFVLPRLYQVTQVGDDMDAVGDLPLVRLRRAAYRSWMWRCKRVLDVVVAAVAIVLLLPVLVACALAVRLEGGRGIIFRQERVGVDGLLFEVLKFRSLRPADESESQTNWNIAKDDRVGPVGKFIRRTSLDELPQLFNILRGDMSLVGPRPERPYFVAEFDRLYGDYGARHRVPCGLTGWAQVHGLRGNTSIEDRAKFDNFYIENWSFWLDLKILLLTTVSVFKSPGA